MTQSNETPSGPVKDNASDDALDKRYDRRSKREKAAQRRRYFDI